MNKSNNNKLNKETLKALKEADRISKDNNVKAYDVNNALNELKK